MYVGKRGGEDDYGPGGITVPQSVLAGSAAAVAAAAGVANANGVGIGDVARGAADRLRTGYNYLVGTDEATERDPDVTDVTEEYLDEQNSSGTTTDPSSGAGTGNGGSGGNVAQSGGGTRRTPLIDYADTSGGTEGDQPSVSGQARSPTPQQAAGSTRQPAVAPTGEPTAEPTAEPTREQPYPPTAQPTGSPANQPSPSGEEGEILYTPASNVSNNSSGADQIAWPAGSQSAVQRFGLGGHISQAILGLLAIQGRISDLNVTNADLTSVANFTQSGLSQTGTNPNSFLLNGQGPAQFGSNANNGSDVYNQGPITQEELAETRELDKLETDGVKFHVGPLTTATYDELERGAKPNEGNYSTIKSWLRNVKEYVSPDTESDAAASATNDVAAKTITDKKYEVSSFDVSDLDWVDFGDDNEVKFDDTAVQFIDFLQRHNIQGVTVNIEMSDKPEPSTDVTLEANVNMRGIDTHMTYTFTAETRDSPEQTPENQEDTSEVESKEEENSAPTAPPATASAETTTEIDTLFTKEELKAIDQAILEYYDFPNTFRAWVFYNFPPYYADEKKRVEIFARYSNRSGKTNAVAQTQNELLLSETTTRRQASSGNTGDDRVGAVGNTLERTGKVASNGKPGRGGTFNAGALMYI